VTLDDDWTTEDIRHAIWLHEDFMTRMPDPLPEAADNGYVFAAIYDKHEFLFQINSAIFGFSKALVSGPLPKDERPRTLFDIGKLLAWRFEVTGQLEHLSLAIKIFEVSMFKKELDSCEGQSSLAGALAARYLVHKTVQDINRAIDIGQVTVTEAKRSNHQKTSAYLTGLGRLYGLRFEGLGPAVADDLDKAIQCYSEALKFVDPELVKFIAKIKDRLGSTSFKRLQHACAQGDVTNWEVYWKDAAQNLMSAADIDSPKPMTNSELFRVNLAKVLMYTPPNSIGPLADVRAGVSNIDLGISLLQELATGKLKDADDPSLRVEAALRWARFEHRRGRFSEASRGYSIAIELVPLLGWNGIAGQTRVGSAKRLRRLASDATSCAIQQDSQEHFEEAIEISEYVRSLFWRALSRFRSDTAKLRETDSGLADKLSNLAKSLEEPSLKRQLSGIVVSGDKLSIAPGVDLHKLQKEEEDYRELIKEWDRCVQDVRKVKGFEDFLRRRPFSVLKEAASAGPVVILIVGSFHADALIVRANAPVQRIPLNITKEEVTVMLKQLNAEVAKKQMDRQDWVLRDRVLGPLWSKVCEPVLAVLKPTPMEHIWWCPTGNLSFLPIHAAGKYKGFRPSNQPIVEQTVPQRVISSFTASLGQLLDSRSRAVCSKSRLSRLLVVGKKEEPSYDPEMTSLEGVPQEIEKIKGVFADASWKDSSLRLGKCLMDSESKVDTVLQELNDFVHFSCHGKQGRINPILSGLLLHDKPLTLLDLLNHWNSRQSQSNVEFAFLSACETATGIDLLPDQALHLAAGMQFVGSLRVVATLWTIQDNFTVLASRCFYGELASQGIQKHSRGGDVQWDVGVALHNALREAVEEDLKLRKTKSPDLWGWVPYIHMGV
jgi:CHAT domain-containing protein/tetratricopeptide (TPR) repeat protein